MSNQNGFSVSHLAVAITFFYDETRLPYLATIASHFPEIAAKTSVWVVTNAQEPSEHNRIRELFAGCQVQIVVPSHLGHPLLLPWFHRDIFKDLYESRQDISHFLYVEDDLEITPESVAYWLEARRALEPFRLIPSFLRVEYDALGVAYSSDVPRRTHLRNLPRLQDKTGYWVNVRYPYQGCYLMDRELMGEFLTSRTQSPDSGTWPIREKANQGLIYANVPDGCFSRAFIRVDLAGVIDSRAMIHHLPNNYVAQKGNKYGSLRADQIISTDWPYLPTWVSELRRLVSLRLPKKRALFVRSLESFEPGM